MSLKHENQFQLYYKDYQSMVFSLCKGFVKGDTYEARDLVQEVFIRVWNALPDFKGNASPKTWIYRISVNTCLLHLRNQQTNLIQPLNENLQDISQEEENTPSDYSELYSAINQLAEMDRIIILLVLDELKYDEISAIVGIAEGALRVRIHRSKQKLNEILNNYGK
ncbi:MAG: hypothetical protein A2041_14960 [Bacteroidetes bacterium GWA2_31_9b]|nr:MAG: hypothetical protein A2041_14960 [Bacteroidetes bacterium GWA2_31_9b]